MKQAAHRPTRRFPNAPRQVFRPEVDILYSNTAFMPGSGLVMNLITWLIIGLP